MPECKNENVKIDDYFYMILAKGFILGGWYGEALRVLKDRKLARLKIADLVRGFVSSHREKIWLPRAKLRVETEKAGIIGVDELKTVGETNILNRGINE
ncbi:hypothetical protein G9A89_002191 [Geosiphon pyriformis]|nr:hypothetical protein G9A89_002191 [Geosiphon pyriformis]